MCEITQGQSCDKVLINLVIILNKKECPVVFLWVCGHPLAKALSHVVYNTQLNGGRLIMMGENVYCTTILLTNPL